MSIPVVFRGTLPKYKSNFRQIMEEELEEIMRNSAKKFVRAASSRVPRLTGQARGALLARLVGTNLVRGPDPRSTRKPKNQSPATGAAMSNVSVTAEYFVWETSVPYFARHDSAEWGAIEQGKLEFFNEFIQQAIESNIPDKIIDTYRFTL